MEEQSQVQSSNRWNQKMFPRTVHIFIFQYTIVHNNPAPGTMDFTEQSFTWQAPSEEGEVDFR